MTEKQKGDGLPIKRRSYLTMAGVLTTSSAGLTQVDGVLAQTQPLSVNGDGESLATTSTDIAYGQHGYGEYGYGGLGDEPIDYSDPRLLEVVPHADADWDTYEVTLDGVDAATAVANTNASDTATTEDGVTIISGGIKGGKDPEGWEITARILDAVVQVDGYIQVDGEMLDLATLPEPEHADGTTDGSDDGTTDGSDDGTTDGDLIAQPRTEFTMDSQASIDQFTWFKGGCDGIPCEQNRTIVNNPSADGGGSLEIFWPEGRHQGSAMKYEFGKTWGFEPEEVWAQYWVFFPQDFIPGPMGTKQPGFDGNTGCGSANNRCNGDGFSARGGLQPPGRAFDGQQGAEDKDPVLGYYIYQADGTRGQKPAAQVARGEWHKIDQHLKLNTPGQKDGILQMWIDDQLAYDQRDFFARDGNNADVKIESYWWATYWGGGEPSPVDNRAYYDALRISDQPFDPVHTEG